VANLRARNFGETLDLLARLAQSGVVAPYPELAQHVTRELGLPQREQMSVASSQLAGSEMLEEAATGN